MFCIFDFFIKIMAHNFEKTSKINFAEESGKTTPK